MVLSSGPSALKAVGLLLEDENSALIDLKGWVHSEPYTHDHNMMTTVCRGATVDRVVGLVCL